MQTAQCRDASEFLRQTSAYRASHPLHTNVLGSIATSTAAGFRDYDAYWWWIVLERGDVVGAACRTAPFCLQLGPMNDEAASSLAYAIAQSDDEFPCLNGGHEEVRNFLAAYATTGSHGSSRTAAMNFENVIYEASAMRVPDVPGRLRLATMSQFDLASTWMTEFSTFINGAAYQPTRYDLDALRARIEGSMLYFWCVEEEPVSMAGHAAPVSAGTETVTRIAPVYTPETHRQHGFAAAATAALTNALMSTGSRVMLLADATYPTSNYVYQGIGYFEVDRVMRFELS
jgi:predicted GNAT family acetyltransferase